MIDLAIFVIGLLSGSAAKMLWQQRQVPLAVLVVVVGMSLITAIIKASEA